MSAHDRTCWLVPIVLSTICSLSSAAPPEPRGPHPRLLLDDRLRADWRAQAKQVQGPVWRAIDLCAHARRSTAHDRAVYQGAEWSKVLQACLVAWAATDVDEFATTAIRFYTALLDDRDRIGDGLGDTAIQRDHGYSIRNLGPYTALAYDWLHDKLTPALREKTRQRWAAWLGWYAQNGYRAHAPGSNYQAGYLVAATLIAIAQGGEAGDAGTQLWRYVADELWGKDMAAALASGGILDGGDWPEGWQYGPLAVTSYSLAARVAKRAGIPVGGIARWLGSVLRRHVYGLSPSDGVFPGGDTQEAAAYLHPYVNTLNAIALGDAQALDRRYAKSELERLRLRDIDNLLHDALASVGDAPVSVPRASWPTAYVSAATGTFYARTRWDARAIWFVAECQGSLALDHRHPKAGNFVLSRGDDDLIVDPSPYGSQSTLTSNAPTVASAQLPENYTPSQAVWGTRSKFTWATQLRSGVVTARCDYADQYRFQHRPSDIPLAQRDFVLLPSPDGQDASLVVIDRARTSDAKHDMYLRFRTTGALRLAGNVGTARIGGSDLTIQYLGAEQPQVTKPRISDCSRPGTGRGQCETARFPVSELRIEIAGPEPRAIHVLHAMRTGTHPSATQVAGDTWDAVQIAGARDAFVVWPRTPVKTLRYRAPRTSSTTHVIFDVAADAELTVRAIGDSCEVRARTHGPHAQVRVITLDATCAITSLSAGPSSLPAKADLATSRGK